MANNIDIIDVMIACHRGELKIVVQNGFFLLENTKSGERVRLNKADVAPNVHGWWNERVAVNGEVYCSECGTIEAVRDSNFKTRFCPNCGARMAGGVG